jgi:TonB-dependent receptor
MKIFYFLVLLFTVQITFSQQAGISGKIIEEASGKPVSGATIKIKNTNLSTLSDLEGDFIFRNIKVGKYELQFSAFTFETKVLTDVEVLNNETTNLTISLAEKNNALDEVVIKTVKAKSESVKSLLTMQKNSIRVSDGISAESIKRTPDKTASDVLKRISGASIQDNKFVIIRGLNDRYNTTYLNGAPLPSTEPDRKAFSFDIFPANMIDNLVIYKTASPDLPGEFAGGVIEINTKATPDKDFQSLSIGTGYNTITTGKNQLYSSDAKSSGLPTDFPTVAAFQSLQQTHSENSIMQIASLAKSYQTDWSLQNKTFDPNSNFQLVLGRHYNLKTGENLGLLVSVSHSTTNNYTETTRKTYETPGALATNQLDQNYSVQTLTAAIANLSLKLNANNNFSFKNLYSINTDNRVMDRNGSLNQESDPLYINTTSRMYTNNKIYTGQLLGEHFFTESKIKINWVGTYSKVNRLIPSERRNSYTYTKFDNGTVSQPRAEFSINSVGGDYPGSIYTSENNESIFGTKVDVSKKIKIGANFTTDVKIGAITQSRYRTFDARQLGYIPFNGGVGGVNYGNSTFSGAIPTQGNASIFNTSNIGILGANLSGLTLFDGTKGNDSYKAESKLNAAYLMFDNVFNKFRFVWGARLESATQFLSSKSDSGVPVEVNVHNVDVLPSLNIIYSVTKKQNLRFSLYKTLNRPEFRELAPFLFYDFATKFNTFGDKDLKTASIINADLRYEIFPGKGQLFSISAFYKEFTNPIELQAQANNSNQYRNANSGTNRGFELEYRTLVSSIFGTESIKLFEDTTIYTNLAIIRSKVDISNLVTSTTLTDIPMQGQSPYVFNGGLQYLNKELGLSFSSNVNRIGNRIAIHGNQTPGGATPAYWEKSRTFLDFQIGKSFLNNKLELKLNIQNALAQDLIFYQNNDELKSSGNVSGIEAAVNNLFTGDSQNHNGYDSNVDDAVWTTKFGRTFSLSLGYSF